MKQVDASQFATLFLNNTPLLDVRAELEFARGSFPGACNLPILNDAERHEVGLCYKQQGQPAAIELGHQLVGGSVKQQRLQAWRDYVAKNPQTHVMCWRGGMRSNLAQQWLAEAGLDVPLVQGGYKALRRFLLPQLEQPEDKAGLLVVGGKTGTAKTVLINALLNGVDLERHANHRGSSFGRRVSEPPAQGSFENALAIDLLRVSTNYPGRPVVLEDEGRRIGPVSIPPQFFARMRMAPLVLVEMPLQFRVQRVLQEYVTDMQREFAEAYGAAGFERYRQYLLDSLQRIRKRLGPERYQVAFERMSAALAGAQQDQRLSAHEAWIELLLTEYYDPMYDYQLDKVIDRVVFRGDYQQVLEWAKQQNGA